jgi:hypothetical protein
MTLGVGAGFAMSPRSWFRVRGNGLGWTPVTWQGWLVTVASAAAFILADLLLVIYLVWRHR